MKKRYVFAGVTAVVCVGIYAANASWLAPVPTGKPQLLAHRGVYQHYDRAGLTNDTCTASRILPPTNSFLENTIPSMRASLDDGADVIELDIHPTTDGDFAVFHDWTLDCRTDGHGTTRDHTMAELKQLDIGYGYTADGGKTFPFRGKFRGMMPSLGEVLEAFPDTHFLINFKSNDPHEADLLDAWLKAHPSSHPERLSAYGGDKPVARMAVLRPDFRPFSKASLKACGYAYIGLGWSGFMPKACHNTTLYLPQNLTWLAWGYPNRLENRFARVGSYIYLLGPQQGRAGLQGINTPTDLAKVPKDWHMGILTDDIETIGPALKARD